MNEFFTFFSVFLFLLLLGTFLYCVHVLIVKILTNIENKRQERIMNKGEDPEEPEDLSMDAYADSEEKLSEDSNEKNKPI